MEGKNHIKNRMTSIEDMLSRKIETNLGIASKLVAEKPGHFANYQSNCCFPEDMFIDKENISSPVVDINEWLEAYRSVLENPERIRDYVKHIHWANPLRVLKRKGDDIFSGLENGLGEEEIKKIHRKQIEEASNKELIHQLFGLYSNHNCILRFTYDGSRKDMEKYLNDVVLKGYVKEHTRQYLDGKLFSDLVTYTYPLEDMALRGPCEHGKGYMNMSFIVSDKTICPKEDGRDMGRWNRIKKIMDDLRGYDKLTQIYFAPRENSCLEAEWYRK